MEFLFDLHCHTAASGHARGTIEEHLSYAKEIGLKLAGISEHGPSGSDSCPLSHIYGMLPLPSEINGMPWLKGIEANIIAYGGEMDVPSDLMEKLDYVIASWHSHFLTPRSADENTETFIAVMNNPLINIIGHPGDPSVPINIPGFVEHAKRTGTLIEINNLSLTPGESRYDGGALVRGLLAECIRQNAYVIAGSDAHMSSRVGGFAYVREIIEESGIDERLVVNTDIELFRKILKGKV